MRRARRTGFKLTLGLIHGIRREHGNDGEVAHKRWAQAQSRSKQMNNLSCPRYGKVILE